MATLTSDWYTDTTSIFYLDFYACELQLITADAFKLKTLQDLRRISFEKFHSLEFAHDAFACLNELKLLFFSETTLKNFNGNLLQPIAHTLTILMLTEVTVNPFDFFGYHRLPHVYRITVNAIGSLARITVNSFAQLPRIREIYVTECGTEAIQLGAFDRLKELRKLFLPDNKLKTLPALFYAELPKLAIDKDAFVGNPWVCDCNIYALTMQHGDVFRIDCQLGRLADGQMNCNGTIETSAKELTAVDARQCWRQYGTNALRVDFYRNYRMKLIDGGKHLLLNSSRRTMNHILLVHVEESMAYNLTTGIKYTKVSMAKLRLSIGTNTLCIIDAINAKSTMSPFHCVTATYSVQKIVWLGDSAIYSILAMVGSIYVITFASSVIVGILWVRHNLNLMKDVSGVIIIRQSQSRKIDTALVMPKQWVKQQTLKGTSEINRNKSDVSVGSIRELNQANYIEEFGSIIYHKYEGIDDDSVPYDYCEVVM